MRSDKRYSVRKVGKNGVSVTMHSYLVTNIHTNQKYIGITSQNPPQKRWNRHLSEAKRNLYQTALHRAIRQHGCDAFTFTVLDRLEHGTYDDLLALEQRLILQYDTKEPNGYNMTTGGQGTVGYKWTEEAKQRLSEKTKGRSMQHATEASNRVTKGRPLSPEHRAKISAAHQGKKMGPMSQEQKEKIRASNLGRKPSEESLRRARRAQQKRWENPENRVEASNRAKGYRRNEKGLFSL